MASKVIKGLTVEIGGDTTKLGKALDKVETKTKDLSRELGEVNRLLKVDPGNTELLAQKQQILAEAVENTKEKLDTLKEAEAQVQAQFERGEVSAEQVRALRREIEATEQKLKGYERAADETADEVRRLGENADDAAEHIDDAADAADDAKDEAEDLGSALDGALAGGFAAVAAAAAAATAAIVGCVESSHEYRTALGKLETAFTTNGHSADTAYNTYADLQSVLGETDQAVEAANHLAVMVDNEEDLARWTKIATGAYAAFGDSLPIEGLTEAANETAKVGKVTGPLADALNWAAQNGNDFGLTLKENINFKEKSAKALKKMTKKQRESYEAQKKQHKEIEAYNNRILEAISAEDKFNIALENCTTEQERQQLIMDTLSESYDEAADVYRETNKEVIAANRANEDWNKTVAEIGETMAPVVTDFKKFGTELLKEVADPLKDVAKFIQKDVLPALTGITNWIRGNIPVVKSTLVGITAAIVAFKVATIAAEVAQKGLKGAILATTAAQKALDLVQKASPIGLIATAVIALTAAVMAYHDEQMRTIAVVQSLTEEQQKQVQASRDAAAAWRDQVAATTESEAKIQAQMGYIEGLKAELDKLVDANGRVKDSDKARVDFILSQLNEALGTEAKMIGGVIDGYSNLKKSIDEVIEAKRADLLLEANSEAYVTAIQNKQGALDAFTLAEKDYLAQVETSSSRELELLKEREEELKYWEEVQNHADEYMTAQHMVRLSEIDAELKAHEDAKNEKKKVFDDTKAEYDAYVDAIEDYEAAQTAILQGSYDVAVDILTDKVSAQEGYASAVEESVQKNLAALAKEAAEAGKNAEETKKNFKDGVKGYTEEMVTEAEQGYNDALAAYEDAYVDAQGIGDDMGKGLAVGLENERDALRKKAKSIVNSMIAEMRKTADSHSPARKLIDFGEDMGAGTEIGLENKTKDLLATAKNQVDKLMGAYADAGDDVSQTAFQNVSRAGAQREAQAFTAMADNAGKLDKILAAIERGQVLTIDGKQLVGQTAAMYDNELGRRRALAARGAL